jgi:hypothetical protein
MPQKKSGYVRHIVAVVFTTIVAPVLANLLVQQTSTWQQTLSILLEGNPPTAWSRSAVEDVAHPSHAGAWLDRPVPAEMAPPRRLGEGSRDVWGR